MGETKSEILQGTLDLMVLRRSKRWGRCTATASRAGLSS
jgi:hypothetical protein